MKTSSEQAQSILNQIDRHLKKGHLAHARALYKRAPGIIKRYLRAIYGILIVGELPSQRFFSRAVYPAILANGETEDFELVIERVHKSISNFEQWPGHLQELAHLALSKTNLKPEQLHLSFFPLVKIGTFVSSKEHRLLIDLGQKSDSYSAAIYVALRILADPSSDLVNQKTPYLTGCYDQQNHCLIPPNEISLRSKCRNEASGLMTPKKGESPDEFYRRCFMASPMRSIIEVEQDLKDTKLLLSEKIVLFREAHELIKKSEEKKVFSKSACHSLYITFITLASHTDQLHLIEPSVYKIIEESLKDDTELFFKYVCVRLNKDLHQLKPVSALHKCESLIQGISDLPIIPKSEDEAYLKSYPIGYCYLWNTLTQVMVSNQETKLAIQLVKSAIKRTELNEYSSLVDLIWYKSRLGQILSLAGKLETAVSEFKDTIAQLDRSVSGVNQQSLETSKVFIYYYLARALAHQGQAKEAKHYFDLGERLNFDLPDLVFTKFEIRFLLSLFSYEDYQTLYNDWIEKQNESKDEQLYRYSIDRVLRVLSFTQKYIHAESPILPDAFNELRLISSLQYQEFGHCAAF